MLGDVRKELRDLESRLSMAAELKRRRHQRTGMSLAHDNVALPRERLSSVLLERGLGIECVHVANAAAHEQRDHPLGTRCEMRRLGSIWRGSHRFGRTARRRAEQLVLPEEPRKSEAAQSAAAVEQEIAA